MSLLQIISLFVLIAASIARASVVAPPLAPAPIVTPAFSYARTYPYNVPPFAASVNIYSRVLPAAPAPVFHAAPLAAGILPGVAPAFIPQARSVHPPTFLPAPAYPFAAPLAAPLPAPLPVPHAFPAPTFGAPFAPAFAAPIAPGVAAPAHALLPPVGPAVAAPAAALAPPLWRR